MVLLIWICALLLCLCGSLAAWGVHALLTAGPGWLELLPAWLDGLPGLAVLDAWVPGWRPLLLAAAAALELALSWLGAAALVLVWGLWVLGSASVLALAGGLAWAVRRATVPRAAAAA